ncbi:uncharacterized protein C8Q71DRAFT_762668 [Rhodofomes roseus]|uniref:Uncharacterized protein n=1 Tax=Rhodofomes roseus TaxID=34475 RepID=A0A4Y9Z6L3_9APHY|nr:uncharacterized protein C8Q71DRAFT_762668 [Rhodofomes roseus]KAH9835581.1 hypothetical protein C8Q71DRAFT_762668 [Rhodofomes roseus]TFY69770.1 hypothetical protein EVJ58_g228 [Rhodofomes roseus]
MRVASLLTCIALPLLAAAQNSSGSQQQSSQQQSSSQGSSQASGSQASGSSQQSSVQQTVIVTTVTTVVPSTSWAPGNVVTGGQTITSSFPHVTSITTTEVISSTSIIGGGNNKNGGSASSTPKVPASTAPSSINGGGTGAPNGAPSPGQSGSHGKYGPNETYIASALAVLPPLPGHALFTVVTGMAIGAAMVFA